MMPNWRQGEKELIRHFAEYIDKNFVENYCQKKEVRFSSNFNVGYFHPSTKIECLMHGMRQEIFEHLRSDVVNSVDLICWDKLVEAAQDAESLFFLKKRQQEPKTKVGTKYSQRKSREKFQIDDDGYVIVYADGACLNHGQSNPKGGIGIWFGNGHPLNVSKPLNPTRNPVTSTVAEIKAATEALRVAKKDGIKHLSVHTKSQFLVGCMDDHIQKWLANDWRKANGKPAKNKKQFVELLETMGDMYVKWIFVTSQIDIKCNVMADRLAKDGAERMIQFYH